MNDNYDDYYDHLNKISLIGKFYKRFIVAPLLYSCAKKFGNQIAEVGCGVGSGLIGAFPKRVMGLEINPKAVAYCQSKGLNVNLIQQDSPYPVNDSSVDVCVMDNVLEHLQNPSFTLSECSRITKAQGGLVVAVPGAKGYAYDNDHKIFYDAVGLKNIHPDWTLCFTFSTPFLVKSTWLSKRVRQYCLVAVYKKKQIARVG